MLHYKGLPITMKKKWDVNGNRIVVISVPRSRGFSIQTNGNLPNTHNSLGIDEAEVVDYVMKYGTHRQKEVLSCGK